MITQWLRYGVLLLLVVWISGGCSGNDSADDGGIGGMGTVEGTEVGFGRITAFGSIEVADIFFDIDEATLAADGETIPEAGLGLGDIVRIFGSINADGRNGIATAIIANDEVEGPVTDVTRAAEGVIAVLGHTIRADQTLDTIFDGFNALTDLAQGNVVEVHGFIDPDTGDILATSIELKATAVVPDVTLIEIKGRITNFTGDQFRLRGLTVRLTTTTEIEGTGDLANGLLVEVKGTLNADFDTLTAVKIEDADGTPFDNTRPGGEVKIEGLINDFNGLENFRVRDVPVNAQNAEIEDGAATNLANGVLVEVKGAFDTAGVLLATEVEIERQNPVRIEANVVDAPTATSINVGFGTQTLTVHVTAATQLRDETGGGATTLQLTNVLEGNRVKIRAFQDTATGKVIATRLEHEGSDDADDDVKLRGPVDRVEGQRLVW
jgi:hypothetical protein